MAEDLEGFKFTQTTLDPEERLKEIKQYQKALRKYHEESHTYIRSHPEQLLNPEIFQGESILSEDDFVLIKALNLPKDIQPDEIITRLRDIAPLVIHF